jgi:hypothetical protein
MLQCCVSPCAGTVKERIRLPRREEYGTNGQLCLSIFSIIDVNVVPKPLAIRLSVAKLLSAIDTFI